MADSKMLENFRMKLLQTSKVKEKFQATISKIKSNNIEEAYRTVQFLIEILDNSANNCTIRLNALFLTKMCFQTLINPVMCLIEVYLLPSIIRIAQQLLSDEQQLNSYEQILIQHKKSIKEGQNYDSMITLARQFIYSAAMIKKNQICNRRQIEKAPSLYRQAAEKLADGNIQIKMWKYYSNYYIENNGNKFLESLANRQYQQIFISHFKSNLESCIIKYNKLESFIIQNLKLKQLLQRCGDSELVRVSLNVCQQFLNDSENFKCKQNALELINFLLNLGYIEAVFFINQDHTIKRINEKVAQVPGHKGLNAGQLIYPEIDSDNKQKNKFYIKYLECLLNWSQCLKEDEFSQQPNKPSEIFKMYSKLKKMNFVFPQLSGNKFTLETNQQLKRNMQRNLFVYKNRHKFQRGKKQNMVSSSSKMQSNYSSQSLKSQRSDFSLQKKQSKLKKQQLLDRNTFGNSNKWNVLCQNSQHNFNKVNNEYGISAENIGPKASQIDRNSYQVNYCTGSKQGQSSIRNQSQISNSIFDDNRNKSVGKNYTFKKAKQLVSSKPFDKRENFSQSSDGMFIKLKNGNDRFLSDTEEIYIPQQNNSFDNSLEKQKVFASSVHRYQSNAQNQQHDLIVEPDSRPLEDSYYRMEEIKSRVYNKNNPSFRDCFDPKNCFLPAKNKQVSTWIESSQQHVARIMANSLKSSSVRSKSNTLIPSNASYIRSQIRLLKQQDKREKDMLYEKIHSLQKSIKKPYHSQAKYNYQSSAKESRVIYDSRTSGYDYYTQSNKFPKSLASNEQFILPSHTLSRIVECKPYKDFLKQLNHEQDHKKLLKIKTLLMKNESIQIGILTKTDFKTLNIELYITPEKDIVNFNYSIISNDKKISLKGYPQNMTKISKREQKKITIQAVIHDFPFCLPYFQLNIVYQDDQVDEKNCLLPLSITKLLKSKLSTKNSLTQQVKTPDFISNRNILKRPESIQSFFADMKRQQIGYHGKLISYRGYFEILGLQFQMSIAIGTERKSKRPMHYVHAQYGSNYSKKDVQKIQFIIQMIGHMMMKNHLKSGEKVCE